MAMEMVNGIGGVFFRSNDPEALSSWYQAHLGVRPPGATYEEGSWWQETGPTVFSPFPADTDYFGAQTQQWMVNFRVSDLDAMVSQLEGAGVEVTVDPVTHPNGRFARLADPEGNPIEIWEPAGADLVPPPG